MTAAHQAIDTAGTPPLVFTDSAAIKVGELIREEGNPNLKLPSPLPPRNAHSRLS